MFVCSLLSSCVIAILFGDALTRTIEVKNNCPYTLWMATLTGANGAQLAKTGFQLDQGKSEKLDVPAGWDSGRIWARTQCDAGPVCVTGDCGAGSGQCNGKSGAPPATLAEFFLKDGGQDVYDVSLVDGFNVPASITPQGGSGGNCKVASCSANVNEVCPAEFAVKNKDNQVVGCKSACVVYNKPEYCCTGDHNTVQTCPPTNYSKIFKDKCPMSYTYAFDDATGQFQCTGGPNYLVTFCP